MATSSTRSDRSAKTLDPKMPDYDSRFHRHGLPVPEVEQMSTRPQEEICPLPGDVRELDHRSAKRVTKSLPRAKWTHQMKTFLIELLKDYNVPGYRTQNAWSKEAWTNILNRMNQKFSLSLTLSQVKQKEQDLKKDFRTVKELVSESGFGWDPNRMMVVAPDAVWETFGDRTNKDALIWREKSFPYYDDLFILYEGRYAEGKNRHGMDYYASKAMRHSHEPAAHSPPQEADNPLRSPSAVHVVDESCMNFSFDEEDEMGSAEFSQQQHPFRPPVCSAQKPSQFVPTPEMHESKRRKRKKSGEFQERYLQLKKEEIDRFAAIEEKKLEDPYSISKCVRTLEGLEGLQMSDVVMAADIFKSKENRELFLSFSSDELRLGWVKNQIRHVRTNY